MVAELTNKNWISLVMCGVNPEDYLFDEISPTNCDANGNTLLHYAAYLGSYELCRVLLSEGWFVLQKNSCGETALDYGISNQSVRMLLEEQVGSLPNKVLDFTLSNPPQIQKQQARRNWRVNTQNYPESIIDEELNLSKKDLQEPLVEVSPTIGSAKSSTTAQTQEDHGYFSPVNVIIDPDASDWSIPEELMTNTKESGMSSTVVEKSSSSTLGPESNVSAMDEEMSIVNPSDEKAYRTLSGRASSVLMLIRVFSFLLGDEKNGAAINNSEIQNLITEQDHENYGDAIDLMRRVFDDEVRVFRGELTDSWENLRNSISNEVEDLSHLAARIALTNLSVRAEARNLLTSEEINDYGDSVEVMLRAFSEKLMSADHALGELKRDLIMEISSLKLKMGELVDALDRIKSHSTSGGDSIITDADIEDYGESIDIMRRLCRAELVARVSILNDFFSCMAK